MRAALLILFFDSPSFEVVDDRVRNIVVNITWKFCFEEIQTSTRSKLLLISTIYRWCSQNIHKFDINKNEFVANEKPECQSELEYRAKEISIEIVRVGRKVGKLYFESSSLGEKTASRALLLSLLWTQNTYIRRRCTTLHIRCGETSSSIRHEVEIVQRRLISLFYIHLEPTSMNTSTFRTQIVSRAKKNSEKKKNTKQKREQLNKSAR